jgi:hypothetical protein
VWSRRRAASGKRSENVKHANWVPVHRVTKGVPKTFMKMISTRMEPRTITREPRTFTKLEPRTFTWPAGSMAKTGDGEQME